MKRFKWDKKYLYWGVTAFLVIIACIAFFWFIQRWDGVKSGISNINTAFAPIIWGIVFAYLLTPVVKYFQSRLTEPLGKKLYKKKPEKAEGFARGLSVAMAIVLFLGVIVAFLIIVIPQVYWSLVSIVDNLSGNIARAQAWANKWLEDYPQLEAAFTELVGDIGTMFTNWAREALPQMGTIVTSVSAGVISVVKALFNFFVGIVVSVYVMHSREKFVAQGKKILYSILSVKLSNSVLGVLRFTNKSFMNYFAGQLLDALIVGIICYVGCVLIGIKDAVLICVIIGITNIIPFFGPFIGAIPSALIVLMSSPIQALIFLIFIVALQQFDGNIMAPRIIGNATGLSGFWVMFAIIAGAGIFGPVGMIIGVPLFAVVYSSIRIFVKRRLKKRGLPEETAVYADVDHIDPETGIPVPIERTDEKEDIAESDGKAYDEDER